MTIGCCPPRATRPNNTDNIELSVFHLNVRSLNSKHKLLCQFLELLNLSFNIIVLSEIWSNNITFYCNILPRYTFYYDLPTISNVGGVGIFLLKMTLFIRKLICSLQT